MSNTSRIAKNTLMLYFRQILIMLVSLYTVRVVLETLGAEDYGIYNIVVSVVTSFGFLSGSMAATSQRYFSFDIGRGDFEQQKRTFGLNLGIYIWIVLLVLLLAETIGLWFVNNALVIPLDRRAAASWVYQFAVGGFLCSIMTMPYISLVIAHENMNIYAYASIIEVMLKLGVVFVLRIISIDKLQVYGFLIFLIAAINMALYILICIFRYKECKVKIYWDKVLFKRIISYMGWALLGSVSVVFRGQGTTLLLNQFFSPAVIAARNISFSINSAVSSFMFNYNNAVRPQIVKYHASGERTKMVSLAFQSIKGSFYLMYIFAFPLIIEMPMVLSIWLKNPPAYTVIFTRLVLIEILIGSLSIGISSMVRASEKIKIREIIISMIYLFNLPLSWFLFLFAAPPYSTAYIMVFLTFIALIAEVTIAWRLIGFSVKLFIGNVLLPVCMVSVTSAILPILFFIFLQQGIFRLCVVVGVSAISSCGCIYIFGLNSIERMGIKSIIKEKWNAIKKE